MGSRPAARAVRFLAVPLLTVAAAASMPAAPAAARTAPGAPAVTLAGTGVLNNVVATSARNAWAVGHFGNIGRTSSLIEHWNGTRWTRVRGLRPAAGWLDGVAATSARNAWAVGFSGRKSLILHWNGAAWKQMPSPAPAGREAVLADVTVVSPRDAWAVGLSGSKSLIVHWNGRSWTRVPSPSPGGGAVLTGVSAASARDVWAVGVAGAGKTLTLHWNGTAWKLVPSPGGRQSSLVRVAAISANDAWATGSAGSKALILHWNGTAWKRTPGPAGLGAAALIGVSGTSARNVWAVGTTSGGTASGGGPAAAVTGAGWASGAVRQAPTGRLLILHWNGSAWTRAHLPASASGGNLIGVFAASGRSAWAVGCSKFFVNPKARPVVLRWNGAAWK